MPKIKRPYCNSATKKFGGTKAGSRRWGCRPCGAAFAHRIGNTARPLTAFLGRLLSRKRQSDMPGGGRTFRRKRTRLWEARPAAPTTGEIRRCAFADGMHLAGSPVVLIACTGGRVIGWQLARSENSRSRAAPMSETAPPDAVAAGGEAASRRRAGGYGPRPVREVRLPRLLPGEGAGRLPFAFLDPEPADGGAIPGMDDKIEGGVSAQPGRMPRGRRGLGGVRRAKAVSRRRRMRTEPPLPAAEVPKAVPADAGIEEACGQSVCKPQ